MVLLLIVFFDSSKLVSMIILKQYCILLQIMVLLLSKHEKFEAKFCCPNTQNLHLMIWWAATAGIAAAHRFFGCASPLFWMCFFTGTFLAAGFCVMWGSPVVWMVLQGRLHDYSIMVRRILRFVFSCNSMSFDILYWLMVVKSMA